MDDGRFDRLARALASAATRRRIFSAAAVGLLGSLGLDGTDEVDAKKGAELWIIFDGDRSEVCRKDPGFEVELYVQAEPAALAEWHLGRIEWADALRAERIRVLGPATLARALPTWNRRSPAAWARQA